MKHRSGNPIRDSIGLYNVTKEKFPNMAVFHVSSEDIETISSAKNIQDWFDRFITVRGTRDFHHFLQTFHCHTLLQKFILHQMMRKL